MAWEDLQAEVALEFADLSVPVVGIVRNGSGYHITRTSAETRALEMCCPDCGTRVIVSTPYAKGVCEDCRKARAKARPPWRNKAARRAARNATRKEN